MTTQELAQKLTEVADNLRASAVVLTDAPDDFDASLAYGLRLLDSFMDYKASASL